MEIKFAFKHMDSSDAIKYYVTEKCERLKKYFNGRISMDWNFEVDKQNHIAHVHLVGNHMDFFGEATTHEMHASVDAALDKIERQIKKKKEIVKDHHYPEIAEAKHSIDGIDE